MNPLERAIRDVIDYVIARWKIGTVSYAEASELYRRLDNEIDRIYSQRGVNTCSPELFGELSHWLLTLSQYRLEIARQNGGQIP